MSEWTKSKTQWIAKTAILTAIIIILQFTPIGYIQIGALSITIMMIPVVIGAILVGPMCGLFLGFVFGITSFARCFGLEPFGTVLLGINPVYTFIVCMAPRVLMGWLVGLIFRALNKIDKTRIISFLAASLSGAVLNTVFFMSALILFFWKTDYIQGMSHGTILGLLGLILINAISEAVVCMVVGTAVTKALSKAGSRPKTVH
jgi:uncharacterized membrane protein